MLVPKILLHGSKSTDSEDRTGFNALRWGAPEANYEITDVEEAVNLTAGGEANFTIGAGNWEFAVELGKVVEKGQDKLYTITATAYSPLEVTGISTIASEKRATGIYDLLGRRTSENRGITIMNGLKVIK